MMASVTWDSKTSKIFLKFLICHQCEQTPQKKKKNSKHYFSIPLTHLREKDLLIKRKKLQATDTRLDFHEIKIN